MERIIITIIIENTKRVFCCFRFDEIRKRRCNNTRAIPFSNGAHFLQQFGVGCSSSFFDSPLLPLLLLARIYSIIMCFFLPKKSERSRTDSLKLVEIIEIKFSVDLLRNGIEKNSCWLFHFFFVVVVVILLIDWSKIVCGADGTAHYYFLYVFFSVENEIRFCSAHWNQPFELFLLSFHSKPKKRESGIRIRSGIAGKVRQKRLNRK